METGQMFIDKKRHLDVFFLIQYMLERHEWVSASCLGPGRADRSGSGSRTATRISSAGRCWLSESDGVSPDDGSVWACSPVRPPRDRTAGTRCCSTTRGASRCLCTTTCSSRSRRVLGEASRGAKRNSCRCSTSSPPRRLRPDWASRNSHRTMRTDLAWATSTATCWRTRTSMALRAGQPRR